MSERVVVTKSMMPGEWGIYALVYMQVCAVEDATDEEILDVCNRENEAGTSQGWARVVREPTEHESPKMGPVDCEDEPGRKHFLVAC